jgi:hypothetical protein
MTAADLESVEKALGFPLPGFYKQFMLRYPPSLVQVKPRDWGPITEWEFADDPRLIIEWNRYVRSQPDDTFVEDGPWPDEYLVIGAEEGGNYYVINRVDGSEAVQLWLHDSGEFHESGDTLPGFVGWLLDYFWQFKEDDEKDDVAKVEERLKEEMARMRRKDAHP